MGSQSDAGSVVVAVDSFKGSLTSGQACMAVTQGLRQAEPDIDVVSIPVADGGEGTLDAAIAAGYHSVSTRCHGATGDLAQVDWARRGDDAVIEMAACCGLERADRVSGPPTPERALAASSRGLGEVIVAALREGVKSITIGIGGSASTDGGAGMLEALGAIFLDAERRDVTPGLTGLTKLDLVDLTHLHPRLADVRLTVACDVTSPLLGPEGTAAVFGPQKGLDAAGVALADETLEVFSGAVEPALGVMHRDDPGAGAAGGVGWALMCLGAQYRPGAEVVLGWSNAAERIRDASLVITGEGRLDHQTLLGKTPDAVRRIAREAGVPVWAVCGVCELEGADRDAFDGVLALSDIEPDPKRSIAAARSLLIRLIAEAMGEE
ncbi:glycerate kinase [Acidipropionibacterium jensenii]|uniref:glycerate kinase n=1 Tax=Acidipropionibacterium jensenii TaxID=1749 RepID=UPI002648188A|nr:glycerate kinase [Acidipropionibacterium jensenii]MDN5977436.1 glycerate kinase [Acidipropionibacterium jensenii]MDN6426758.1 glycerate kinase [Acidipropionibacterium jensenii]MDN6480931.1 glycerate kinase [Acidipropionibacterium jensenii]MDN6513107.1 glycerate kinase [Acidipropionibacterium jensenii]MDN6591788.1 glycerate kinase [Acidipropionibacterium jensenii]